MRSARASRGVAPPAPNNVRHDARLDSELSAQEYLDRHCIGYYLRDVTSLLLRCHDDRPLEFIADYFSEVLNGTHVLLREYTYVSRCAHDRWSFVQSIREALADLDQSLPTSDSTLTELLRLVCHDFPREVATDACRLCGDVRTSHPLGELLHATCVRICFADFLRNATDVFRSCDPHNRGRAERSAVAQALRTLAAPGSRNGGGGGGGGASTSGDAFGESVPPPDVFDALAEKGGDVSLHEMMQIIVTSDYMRRLMQMPQPSADEGEEGEGSESGERSFNTLVHSPPRNDAHSPGSACAAACAAASVAANGARRGAGGGRAARERLAEAAAVAAAAAAATQAGSRRSAAARPASSAARRRGTSASSSSFASRFGQAGGPVPPPVSPR